MDQIATGQADIILAAGVETMSDVPIRFSKALRKRMLASQKVKSIPGYLGLLSGLKMKDLAPELPAVAEFSSGETMGFSADRLASAFGVTRQAQDAFALRSHHNAAKAQKAGYLKDIIPVRSPVDVSIDNGSLSLFPPLFSSDRLLIMSPMFCFFCRCQGRIHP